MSGQLVRLPWELHALKEAFPLGLQEPSSPSREGLPQAVQGYRDCPNAAPGVLFYMKGLSAVGQ